ncbi:MAG: lipopolysaccharide biosynthesis protein [Saprospiraceae bacterium]
MSLLKKLAGETAIYGISSILGRVLHFVILTVYLTRVLEDSEYGIFSEMYSYAGMLMVLFTYRMETAFFRYGSKPGELDKSFSTASISLIVSTLLFVGGIVLLAPQIAEHLLQYPDRADYVIWFALIIGFDTLAAIPFARLRLENRPIKFAVIKILNILINAGCIFFFLEGIPFLIAQGFDNWEAFYYPEHLLSYVFVSNLIASACVMLLLLPAYFKIKLQFDFSLWRTMMRYTLPLVVVGFAGIFNQLSSVPLLKSFLPGTLEQKQAAMGLYSASAKIAVLMNLFIQAFNYAAEPFFFNHADRKDARQMYAQTAQAFAMVGSLVFLGILLYLDIVQLMIGENLRGGVDIVPILLLAYFFLGLYYNFSIWYKLKDQTKIGAYISITGVLITLAINFFLLPRIGYQGAAWAALACYAFMAGASYWTGRKYYPIAYPIPKITTYIVVAVLGYFASLFLRPYLQENLYLILLVNTLILSICLAIYYQLEKTVIRNLLKLDQ